MATNDLKIFAMNDSDWCAAMNAEDALKAMAETYSYLPTPEGIAALRKEYEIGEPVELTDEQMDRQTFCDQDEHDEIVAKRSFRERLGNLIAEGQEFPCFFASTEF